MEVKVIKERRQKRILSILNSDGVVEIAQLSRSMPEVSRVTLRRDIAELAEAGALKRTHGGAKLPDAAVLKHPRPNALSARVSAIDGLDAVILPPILGPGADALRRHFRRRAIPFFAELAPQPGGVYLGPDNAAAAYDLGRLAGLHAQRAGSGTVLMIGQPELPNTRLRAQGFEQGYRESFLGELNVIHVNGRGNYRTALRVALDAFEVNDGVGVVFGVNDHSALAGAEAATRSGRRVSVYAIGGERADFVAGVAEEGPLKAVAAFFPEVVGARGIDLVASALSGAAMHADATTPHAIITAENLGHYFAHTADGWALRADREAELIGGDGRSLPRLPAGARVGFMPHFPAHDWYRNMIRAMRSRAQDYGIELVIIPPHQGIAAEISRLRGEIAKAAAQRVTPRQTIILGEGEATLYLAEELRRLAFEAKPQMREITVVTNALDVLRRLEDAPHMKVILTSGEYQAADRCLVGPSLGALFERMRADVAFLSVAGLSLTFGISAQDERLGPGRPSLRRGRAPDHCARRPYPRRGGRQSSHRADRAHR